MILVGCTEFDEFIGDASDYGDKHDARRNTQWQGRAAQQGKDENGDDHHNQQECGAATRVDEAATSNGLYSQFVTGFVRVDGFVLCAVIAKDSLNIRDRADGPYVAQKQSQSDDALQQVTDEIRGNQVIYEA